MFDEYIAVIIFHLLRVNSFIVCLQFIRCYSSIVEVLILEKRDLTEKHIFKCKSIRLRVSEILKTWFFVTGDSVCIDSMEFKTPRRVNIEWIVYQEEAV